MKRGKGENKRGDHAAIGLILMGFAPFLIILWDYRYLIAWLFVGGGLLLAAGYGGAFVFRQIAAARLEWRENQLLYPDKHSFQYPVKLEKDGSFTQIIPTTTPQFTKVTNFSPRQVRTKHVTGQEAATRALEAPEEAQPARLPDMLPLLSNLAAIKPDKSKLEVWLGNSETGPIVRQFGPNMLHNGLLGATFAGKSSQVQSIYTQLILADPEARRLAFFFVDFKQKTSRPLAAAPHTRQIATDPIEAARIINFLYSEMKRRETLAPEELTGEIIYALLLEEFLDLKNDLPKDTWQKVISLATGGRHGLIYLTGLAQAFYADEQTKILRGQFRTRMAFAVEDSGTLEAFGFKDRKKHAALLAKPVPGRFLYRSNGDILLAQAPFISEEEIVEIIAGLKKAAPVETKGQARPGDIIDGQVINFKPRAGWPPPDFWNVEEARFNYYSGLPAGRDKGANIYAPAYTRTPEYRDPFANESDSAVMWLRKAKSAYDCGHTSIRSLAAALNVAPGTASKLLHRLADLGQAARPTPNKKAS